MAVVTYLIKNDADLDALTENKWSSLQLAIDKGHMNLAETLLLCGAQVIPHPSSESIWASILAAKDVRSRRTITDLLGDYGWTPTVSHPDGDGSSKVIGFISPQTKR